MANPSKAKGTRAETAVVNYLKRWFPWVERRVPGTNDRGDITGLPMMVEVKDHGRMCLAEWVDSISSKDARGVVWHKRRGSTDPAEWYVTMKGSAFVKLLTKKERVSW